MQNVTAKDGHGSLLRGLPLIRKRKDGRRLRLLFKISRNLKTMHLRETSNNVSSSNNGSITCHLLDTNSTTREWPLALTASNFSINLCLRIVTIPQLRRLSMLPAIHLNHPSNLIRKHLILPRHKTSKFRLVSPDQLPLPTLLLTSLIYHRSFPIINGSSSNNNNNSSNRRQFRGLSRQKCRPGHKMFNILNISSHMAHPQAILPTLHRRTAMFIMPQCLLHPVKYRRNHHLSPSCSANLNLRFINRNSIKRRRSRISIRRHHLIRAPCRLPPHNRGSRCRHRRTTVIPSP